MAERSSGDPFGPAQDGPRPERAADEALARPGPGADRFETVRRFVEEETGRSVVSLRVVRSYSILERDEALYEAATEDGGRCEVILARDGTLTLFSK